MKKSNYVIVSSRGYGDAPARLSRITGHRFSLISKNNDLNLKTLEKLKPRYIFLPHWSYIVPKEIHENFDCVIFHMTDVPFGRGGTPLQNLIVRKIYKTKVTALKCTEVVDGGPVYMKKPLTLYGSAEEIYARASSIVEDMIVEIILKNPKPIPQRGRVVTFKRRTPDQSEIRRVSDIVGLYDFIRMLDADGYPKAFLKSGSFRFEFGRASIKNNQIIAEVVVSKRKNEI